MFPALLILALGHTLVDFYGTSVTPLLPHFQKLWGLSSTSVGLVVAAGSVAGSILQPLLGFCLDRRGTSRMAALGVLWVSITMFALGWAPSFGSLFVLTTLAYIGSALYHPLGAALARRVSPPDRRGLYMSIFMNVGNLGWALSPFLVTSFVTAFGLPALGWLTLPGLLSAAALAGLGLSLSNGNGNGNRPDPALSVPPEPTPTVSRRVRYRGVAFLLAATILRSWAATGIQTYLPLYLVEEGHTLTFSGAMLSVFILAGTLAGVLVGYLSDRWGSRRMFAGSLLLATAALPWFLAAPPAWAGVAVALSGAAILGTLPLTVVMVQEMLPGHAGTGSGLVIGFAGGVGGLLVLLSGVLADRFGVGSALYWLIPVLPLGALCVLGIPAETCRPAVAPARPAVASAARP